MRELLTARLTHKVPLCQPSAASDACKAFHLSFELETVDAFSFQAGQFISCVAEDPATGKQQTRAYSLASAPAGKTFDLCLNRVPGGFFSNLLCDLGIGDAVQIHGPHGYFTLQPEPSHVLLAASGTGIAPMRGFLQELFPETPTDQKRQIWLVHGPALSAEDNSLHAAHTTLYYRDVFETISTRHANFHYLKTDGDILTAVMALLPSLTDDAGRFIDLNGSSGFPIYAYICGLRAMVTPMRKLLQDHGWAKQQVLSERYD